MATFKVVYPNGSEEVTNQSDCDTVEAFMNVKFGSSKTKAKVTILGEAEEEPAKPKAAKAK